MTKGLEAALLSALQRMGVEADSVIVDDYSHGGVEQWHHGYVSTDDGRLFWFVAARGPMEIEAVTKGFVVNSDGSAVGGDLPMPRKPVVVPAGEFYVQQLDEERL
ncbi:MAG: hypothetical protein ACRDHO_15375 [Actinomycetota bacterium]